MSKARAAGILGMLVVCGLVFVSSLALAGSDPYFKKLQGAFRQACGEKAESDNRLSLVWDGTPAAQFEDACVFLVDFLKTLGQFTPPFVSNETLRDAVADAVKHRPHGPSDLTKCDQCIQTILDIDLTLGLNNTVRDIRDALVSACEESFSELAQVQQCVGLVSQLPGLADLVISIPPTFSCQLAKACPIE
jgi:hypothetical protein